MLFVARSVDSQDLTSLNNDYDEKRQSSVYFDAPQCI